MRPRPILLLVLLALACNRDSPSTPTDPTGPPALAVLLGRTLDPNGTPVPNATVTLIPPINTPGPPLLRPQHP